MDCPKCDSVMEEITFNGIVVDRCTQCKGLWFSGVDYKDLQKMKGSDVIDTGSAAVGHMNDTMGEVPCPVCEDVMDRVADRFQRHIHYEVCRKGHGAYFDAGEFRDYKHETISDFFKSLRLYLKRE